MRRYQMPKVRSGGCEEIPHVQGREWYNHMGHSLSNSMKLSAVLCRAAQEGWVEVERSDTPHERLPEILVVPREKTPTGAAARGNP